jgi:hypothetical protein
MGTTELMTMATSISMSMAMATTRSTTPLATVMTVAPRAAHTR